MKRKIFAPYSYDIALDDGTGAHLVGGMTALMVFFVSLTLVVSFALAGLSDRWMSALTGSLTIEIKPPAAEADGNPSAAALMSFEEKIRKAVAIAERDSAVSEARALSENEIRALIEPWLDDNAAAVLLLPAIIDVKLKEDADTTKLQTDLLNAIPDARIDTHDDALSDIQSLVATARTFVIALTSLIIALGIAAIAATVRAKLAIHKFEVETLHLIGASDEYIARQFRRHTLHGSLRGALAGLGLMLLTVGILAAVTGSMNMAGEQARSLLQFSPAQWALLLATPVLAGSLIARMTAQHAVMRSLRALT